MKAFTKGIQHFIFATAFLKRHKLLHYYLYPLILGIAYYMFLATVIIVYAAQITESIFGDFIPDRLPEFTGFMSFFNFITQFSLHHFITIIAGIVLFLISSKFSKYFILISLSPIFSLLSEKVDEIINHRKYPFNLLQFLKDILRGVIIALRNFILEMALIALFSIIGFFTGPLAILIAPFLWLIGAYFYGFSMLDYTCERRQMNISEGLLYIRHRKYFVLGNGIMYSLLDSIPIVGLIVAPINAVVGATSGILDIEASEDV